VIEEVIGTRHYNVRIGDQIWKRHIDQLISCFVKNSENRPGTHVDTDRSDIQPRSSDPPIICRYFPKVHVEQQGLSKNVVQTTLRENWFPHKRSKFS
jgi:hypothetical protein